MLRKAISIRRAFTLIEVTLSLGIIAFALVLLVAVLPVGLQSNREAREETIAVSLIHALIQDRRFSPPDQESRTYGLPPLEGLASGAPKISDFGPWIFSEDLQKVEPGDAVPGIAELRIRRILPTGDSIEPVRMQIQVRWPAGAPDEASVRTLNTVALF